jgi:hypothetical protein
MNIASSSSTNTSLPPASDNNSSPDYELLTDYEVSRFIQRQEQRLQSSNTKTLENLAWMQKAMLKYFADKRAKKLTSERIQNFITAVKLADEKELDLQLTKRELLHFVNHVPVTGIQLGVCMDSSRMEDSETGDALTQEQEELILQLIQEHLLAL